MEPEDVGGWIRPGPVAQAVMITQAASTIIILQQLMGWMRIKYLLYKVFKKCPYYKNRFTF
jgi:hypothetical protein